MNMETKKDYMAPQLTVVTFKAEVGYAGSHTMEMLTFWDDAQESEQMETYSMVDGWGSGDNNSFWN